MHIQTDDDLRTENQLQRVAWGCEMSVASQRHTGLAARGEGQLATVAVRDRLR